MTTAWLLMRPTRARIDVAADAVVPADAELGAPLDSGAAWACAIEPAAEQHRHDHSNNNLSSIHLMHVETPLKSMPVRLEAKNVSASRGDVV